MVRVKSSVLLVASLLQGASAADYDATLLDLALDNAAAYMRAAAAPLMVLAEMYRHDFFEHRNVSLSSTILSSKRDNPHKDHNDTRLKEWLMANMLHHSGEMLYCGFFDSSFVGAFKNTTYDTPETYGPHNATVFDIVLTHGGAPTDSCDDGIDSHCRTYHWATPDAKLLVPYFKKKQYFVHERGWYHGAYVNGSKWSAPYTGFTTGSTMVSPAKQLHDSQNRFIGIAAADVTLHQLSAFLIDELDGSNMILFVMEESSHKMIAASVEDCVLNATATSVTQFTADDNPSPIISTVTKELASGTDERDAYAFDEVWVSTDFNYVRAVRVSEYHGMPLDSPWIFVEIQPATCDAGYELNVEELRCSKCGPGYFSNTTEAGSTCQKCVAGSSVSDSGATECVQCALGYFTNSSASVACKVCQQGTFTRSTGSISCDSCDYGHVMVEGVCKECRSHYRGADCLSKRGSALETLTLRRGFWRTGPKSHVILECTIDGACLGGNVTGVYCAEGYESYYCQVCSRSYFKSGGQCEACSEGTTTLVLAVTLFIAIVVITFLCWYFAEFIETRIHYVVTPRVRSRLKILVSFSQIMYALPAVFEMAFPAVFEDFLDTVMSVLSLSFLGWPQGFSCLYRTTFYSQFVMGCGVPMTVWFFVLMYYVFAVLRERRKRQTAAEMGASETQLKILNDAAKAERHLAETRCMTFFLLTSYIILPSVSYTIFSMFSCEEFDDGAYLLRTDYQIRCQGVWYQFYFTLAVLAALAFPLGVPLCYFFLLYRKRQRLNPENMDEEEIFKYRLKNRKLDSIRFLFDMYHVRVWWWEVFETGRRLCLTGALMVFEEGSVIQLFCGITICLVSLMMYAHYLPFIEDEDNSIATFAQLEIYFVLMMGMLMQSSANGGEGERVVGILMVATTVMLFAAAIGIEFKGAQAGWRSFKEAWIERANERNPETHMRDSIFNKEMEASGITLLDREKIGRRRAGVGMGQRQVSAAHTPAGAFVRPFDRSADNGRAQSVSDNRLVGEERAPPGSESDNNEHDDEGGATWECKTNVGWEPFGVDTKGNSIAAMLERAFEEEGVVAWAAHHKEGHVIRTLVAATYIINWARYEQINTATLTRRPIRRRDANGVITHPPGDHTWTDDHADMDSSKATAQAKSLLDSNVPAAKPKMSKEERLAKEAAFLETLRQRREASQPPSAAASVDSPSKAGLMLSLWQDLFGNDEERGSRDSNATVDPKLTLPNSSSKLKKNTSLEDMLKHTTAMKKLELAGHKHSFGSTEMLDAAEPNAAKEDGVITPRRSSQHQNTGWKRPELSSKRGQDSSESPPLPSPFDALDGATERVSSHDGGRQHSTLAPPTPNYVDDTPPLIKPMDVPESAHVPEPPSPYSSLPTKCSPEEPFPTVTISIDNRMANDHVDTQNETGPRPTAWRMSAVRHRTPEPQYSDSESEPEEGTSLARGTSWVLAPAATQTMEADDAVVAAKEPIAQTYAL